MEALTALHSRTSVNLLSEPGPNPQQLENIFKAGLRACDHKNLRPWHFLVIEGEARTDFGALMVKVKAVMDGKAPDKTTIEKLKSKPFRAPTILVVVAKVKPHDKVPEIEQVLSAAAAAQMMMTAAHAQGIGAIWRSGELMYYPEMRAGLGLSKNDQIVSFMYLGTAKVIKPLPVLDSEDFVERWRG